MREARIQSTFGFAFADDHRDFLTSSLPVGQGWPNWRADGGRNLDKHLRLPVDGILFAVEWKQFWDDSWGKRPARMKDALRSGAYQLARVPRMVPVHSHCYLPAGAHSSGHPVPTALPTVGFWSDHVS